MYINTGSFIVHVKTNNIYKDIVEDNERRFDTSNFELDRPLPKGKNKQSKWINERWIKYINPGRIFNKTCIDAAKIENKINYLKRKK